MKSFLQMLSGIGVAIAVLIVGWELTGRPPIDAARIGSGFQAVGAAVELYAVLRIVWKPWIRPRIAKALAPYGVGIRKLRRNLHEWFPKLIPPIKTGVKVQAHMTGAVLMNADGEKIRGGSLETRVRSIEKDLEAQQRDSNRRFAEVSERFDAERDAVGGELSDFEEKGLRVRTDDALGLLLGIALSLIGAAWASIG
jgi:hypothetical protein